jgi:UDP-N-acetylmuramoylalanine--D-glutamate ligase
MQETALSGVPVLIVGLAREGTALARFLVGLGARVTVTDSKQAAQLADNMAALSGLPIRFVLGEHPLALLEGVEVVFVSPGVPLELPLLAEARRLGLRLSSETRLFTRLCPARTIGITGSSGKTTTTALTGEILRAAGHTTWVGGNIGRPLVAHLGAIRASDTVVLELSSFQLEFFAPWPPAGSSPNTRQGRPLTPEADALYDPAGWSPHIAAILNITPNHLDRHPSMEAYAAAKRHILAYQTDDDLAVLGWDNPETQRIGSSLTGRQRVVWFSLTREVEQGSFLREGHLVLRLEGSEHTICAIGELKLLGQHNAANVLAAFALAGAAGAAPEALRQVATTFRGVEHRLELVREHNGVQWYNDSIATAPERTVAALEAFHAPVVLLAGGRDKHLPWDHMAALAWRKVRHLILFGEAAGLIEKAMIESPSAGEGACTIHHGRDMAQAVAIAARLAKAGDVVLLAPGATSFDAYADFADRGEHFRRLVGALE